VTADELLGRRLLFTVGKGGVGRTTVTLALAFEAARRGRKVLAVELEGSRALARALEEQREIQPPAPELERISSLVIDGRRALEEYLSLIIPVRRLLKTIFSSSIYQYFVAAAPGAKELITIAKVWELAQTQRWDRQNRAYDLVVVDAPASGHGIGMLTTPRTFGEIARVGPIRRQAAKVSEMLADPARTGYVAVALPEEMPVNETIELERRLRDAVGLGLDAIVMNAMWPERFSSADVTKLRAATRDGHAPEELGAVRAALAAHERVKAQRAHVRRLESASEAPITHLPFVCMIGTNEYHTHSSHVSDAWSQYRDSRTLGSIVYQIQQGWLQIWRQ